MSGTGIPFADADPEDGWDASDPPAAMLDNLVARLHDLLEHLHPDRPARIRRLFDNLADLRERLEH